MARRRPSDPITMISFTGFTARSAGLLLIFSSSLLLLLQAQGGATGGGGGGVESYVPVQRVVYQSISPAAAMTEAAAAPYEPFKVCRKCRCCRNPSDASTCVDTDCCYGINCNLPGKPFGTCAFQPKTCGCNNCTQSAS